MKWYAARNFAYPGCEFRFTILHIASTGCGWMKLITFAANHVERTHLFFVLLRQIAWYVLAKCGGAHNLDACATD